MASGSDSDKILGIILIVLGALVLLGWLNIPFLTEVLGVLLIVLGILMMVGKFSGSTLVAILFITLGVLLLIPFGAFLRAIVGGLIETAIAVVLIIAGILKLMGKW